MDYRIDYWKEKETDPIEFLKHFRCTTEPIGGSTELDDDGELVDWDAAVVGVEMAQRDSRWISVGERLPEPGEHVYVTGVPDEKYCHISKRRDVWIDKRVTPSEHTDGYGFLKAGGHGHFAITHWMSIPKLNGQEIFETLPVE